MASYTGLKKDIEDFITEHKQLNSALPTMSLYDNKLSLLSLNNKYQNTTPKQMKIYLRRYFISQKQSKTRHKKCFEKITVGNIDYLDVIKK
jgi:hypothetical protein